MRHFDENGNFIESIEPEVEKDELDINYHYKKNSNQEY